MKQDEIFPLVDECGNVTGQAIRKECHSGSKILHPVIHLHVFNSAGDLYLQKRSKTKDIQPDKWDSSVGGHIDFGETPEIAAQREAREELGITDLNLHYITKYIIETDIERELTYCFFTVYDNQFNIDNDELSDGRFWTLDEIKDNLGKGIFTYNFECDFDRFLHVGSHNISTKPKE